MNKIGVLCICILSLFLPPNSAALTTFGKAPPREQPVTTEETTDRETLESLHPILKELTDSVLYIYEQARKEATENEKLTNEKFSEITKFFQPELTKAKNLLEKSKEFYPATNLKNWDEYTDFERDDEYKEEVYDLRKIYADLLKEANEHLAKVIGIYQQWELDLNEKFSYHRTCYHLQKALGELKNLKESSKSLNDCIDKTNVFDITFQMDSIDAFIIEMHTDVNKTIENIGENLYKFARLYESMFYKNTELGKLTQASFHLPRLAKRFDEIYEKQSDKIESLKERYKLLFNYDDFTALRLQTNLLLNGFRFSTDIKNIKSCIANPEPLSKE